MSAKSRNILICVLSHSVMSNSLKPHGLYSPQNSPSQNTRVSCYALFQGIFLTQGLNPGHLHFGQILYQQSQQGSPGYLERHLSFHYNCTLFGKGNGTPLQYSCLQNSMDRGAWWTMVHGIAKSRTRLKRLCSSSSSHSLLTFTLHWRKFSCGMCVCVC